MFILTGELNIVTFHVCVVETEKYRRLLVEQCGRRQEVECEVRIRKGTTAASTEREVQECENVWKGENRMNCEDESVRIG